MELQGVKKHILICNGASCKRKGGENVTKVIREEIQTTGYSPIVHTTKTLCNGQCQHGSIVILYPDGIWYKEMNEEKAIKLIQELFTIPPLPQEMLYSYQRDSFNREENKE